MARNRFRLSKEIVTKTAALVRAGVFPAVAAETLGVPPWVFARWMDEGAHARRPGLKRALWDGVRVAAAEARAVAEAELLEKDKRTWLKSGPGRDVPDLPGWSNPARAPVAPPARGPANVLLSPGTLRLFDKILGAMAPFPEARAAVEAVLNEAQEDED